MKRGFGQILTRSFMVAAALAATSIAGATTVHVDSLPSLSAPFSKTTNAYLYLDGEASQVNGDTFGTAADAAKTLFRTGSSPSDSWGTGSQYDLARYAARGADTGSYTGVNAYWTNVSTGLGSGQYDAYIRALPGASGSETFTLYIGADQVAVDAATAAGTVSTNFSGTARWYKLASINLTPDIDTFRLKTDTTLSAVRFDTLFFAPVPEPSAGLILPAAFGIVARRRRTRRDAQAI
jgi:hypothetical protein